MPTSRPRRVSGPRPTSLVDAELGPLFGLTRNEIHHKHLDVICASYNLLQLGRPAVSSLRARIDEQIILLMYDFTVPREREPKAWPGNGRIYVAASRLIVQHSAYGPSYRFQEYVIKPFTLQMEAYNNALSRLRNHNDKVVEFRGSHGR